MYTALESGQRKKSTKSQTTGFHHFRHCERPVFFFFSTNLFSSFKSLFSEIELDDSIESFNESEAEEFLNCLDVVSELARYASGFLIY